MEKALGMEWKWLTERGRISIPIDEIKSVDKVHPTHNVQLLSYMKRLDVPLGLLIKFKVRELTDGVFRGHGILVFCRHRMGQLA